MTPSSEKRREGGMGNIVNLSRTPDDARRGNETLASWAGNLRDAGRALFIKQGFPTRRIEAWRYSDLARALGEKLAPAQESFNTHVLDGSYLVKFENGILDEAGSRLPQSGFFPLSSILADSDSPFAKEMGRINPQADHPVLALNGAQIEQGFVLHLAQGETLDRPLHVCFAWTPAQNAPPEGLHIRLLIVLDEGASATLIETHDGAPGFASVVTEMRLGNQASLKHVRIEQLNAAARQSSVLLGDLAASARYQSFYLSTGGHFARHEALLSLNGEAADAQIDGAYLASDARHCDNTTVITHAAPNTTSRQAFRGVLGGRAHGVYQGCVKVKKEAQGTDARQMSRALLLSHKAEIATKPELEIFADDVKCSHGATAGELDAAALFFLRARGIPEAEARALLVEAFLGEAVGAIENDNLRDLAMTVVRDWLDRHAGEVSHVE